MERFMKALFVGGTGTISRSITELAVQQGWELYLLNRGTHRDLPEGVHSLLGDINDEDAVRRLLAPYQFDVVADFIVMTPEQAARDVRLFTGKTKQYFFISSASAYQKPPLAPLVTEGTTLANPYWQYSRDKIACEELLLREYRTQGFPVTIVRPSHTYSGRGLPLAIRGKTGCWPTLKRMLEGKPVIIHGDGTSLWTVTSSDDFAKGFVGLMGNIHAIGQPVQITGDEALTWNQIHACIADALGVKLHAVHISSELLAAYDPELQGALLGDKAHCALFDNTLLKRLVPDFCATIRFDQGARRSVDYLLHHPEEQAEDPAFDAWCDRVIAAYQSAFPK